MTNNLKEEIAETLQRWFDINKVRIHKRGVNGTAEPELIQTILTLINQREKEAIADTRQRDYQQSVEYGYCIHCGSEEAEIVEAHKQLEEELKEEVL